MSDVVFKPLGDRVLIQPDDPVLMTASGLHLAEQPKPEQTGTVVAVGQPSHPFREEASSLATKLERLPAGLLDEHSERMVVDAAHLLRVVTHREPLVKPGERVVFSWQSGQELRVNSGESRYLLLREADILAVVE